MSFGDTGIYHITGIHIARTRIHARGINGLLQGVTLEGFTKERSSISSVPLKKSYLERCDGVNNWDKRW